MKNHFCFEQMFCSSHGISMKLNSWCHHRQSILVNFVLLAIIQFSIVMSMDVDFFVLSCFLRKFCRNTWVVLMIFLAISEEIWNIFVLLIFWEFLMSFLNSSSMTIQSCHEVMVLLLLRILLNKAPVTYLRIYSLKFILWWLYCSPRKIDLTCKEKES